MTAELDIRPDLLNPFGTAHGGVLASLVDHVLGAVMYPIIPRGAWAATTQLNLNLVAPAREGTIARTVGGRRHDEAHGCRPHRRHLRRSRGGHGPGQRHHHVAPLIRSVRQPRQWVPFGRARGSQFHMWNATPQPRRGGTHCLAQDYRPADDRGAEGAALPRRGDRPVEPRAQRRAGAAAGRRSHDARRHRRHDGVGQDRPGRGDARGSAPRRHPGADPRSQGRPPQPAAHLPRARRPVVRALGRRRRRGQGGRVMEGRARRLGHRTEPHPGPARRRRAHHLHAGLDVGRAAQRRRRTATAA